MKLKMWNTKQSYSLCTETNWQRQKTMKWERTRPDRKITRIHRFQSTLHSYQSQSSKQLNSKLSSGCLACNLQKEPCDISEYRLAAISEWNSEKLVTSPSSRWFGLEASFLHRVGDLIQGFPNFTQRKWILELCWNNKCSGVLKKSIVLWKWIACFNKVVNWFW